MFRALDVATSVMATVARAGASPNTKKEMFESADIVRYLRGTYGLDG